MLDKTKFKKFFPSAEECKRLDIKCIVVKEKQSQHTVFSFCYPYETKCKSCYLRFKCVTSTNKDNIHMDESLFNKHFYVLPYFHGKTFDIYPKC